MAEFFLARPRFTLPDFGSPDKGVHLQGGQDNFYVAWVFALELKLSKTLSGLVYSVPYLYGGRSPPITAIQNTKAHSEFLTTSIPKQKPRLHKNYLDPLVNEPPCLDFRPEAGEAATTAKETAPKGSGGA